MKGLKRSSKIIFVINSLVAFLLLISYVLPYIPPENFASLSVLSLSVPLLILLNFIFFLYWLLRVKKQLLLSLIVLILGWNHISTMYKFSSSNDVEDINNFSIMTYNVRVLNAFNWLPNKTVRQDVISFIQNENPDVLCIQEYTRGTPIKLVGYHDFNATYDKTAKNGLVIYSRFPIIKSGSLEFPNTVNNGIFVDIVKQKDTIRIYNLHLQSAKIKTEAANLKKESSGQLFKQVSSTFKEQQEQVELFLKHKSKCTHKTIVTGDFNNTSYSYIYKAIKGDDFNDTFEEAGNGFGRTFDFKFFPLRIDFILADKDFKVNGFKTYDIKLSDHYPIKATLKLH